MVEVQPNLWPVGDTCHTSTTSISGRSPTHEVVSGRNRPVDPARSPPSPDIHDRRSADGVWSTRHALPEISRSLSCTSSNGRRPFRPPLVSEWNTWNTWNSFHLPPKMKSEYNIHTRRYGNVFHLFHVFQSSARSPIEGLSVIHRRDA